MKINLPGAGPFALFGAFRHASAFRRAAASQRTGNLAEAERICREILADNPDHFQALQLSGVLAAQQGRPAEADRLLTRAVAIDPDSAEAHTNRASVLHPLGRFDEALASCDRALALRPDLAAAQNIRGAALAALGRHDEALASFDRAVAIDENFFEALWNRGRSLQQVERHAEALASFDRALAIKPDAARVLNDRGVALKDLERHDEALACFDRALSLEPGLALAAYNQGTVHQARRHHQDALASFDRAVALRPDFAEALNNRGAILQELQNYEAALASFDRALALRRDFAAALNNRGTVQRILGNNDEALASLDRALALEPDSADALRNRGAVLANLERPTEALASFDRALAIAPGHVGALQRRAAVLSNLGRHLEAVDDLQRALAVDPDLPGAKVALLHERMVGCDWRDHEQRSGAVIADVRGGKSDVNPFAFLGLSDSAPDQLRCAQAWVRKECPPSPAPLWTGERYRHDRIRVAYLSADFRDHATSHLMAGLFERHDRQRFQTTAIAFGPDRPGAMRTRVQAAFEQFIDVRTTSVHDVARLLRARETDIVVDLGGFTTHCRTGIVALRPAPIQVSYLGFPGTMGAEYIDYIIADEVVIPPEHREWYTENVVYLPDSYQVNDSRRRIAERTPSRAEVGLPEAGFVFCSFNNSYKITPAMFDLWMRLLRDVDGSVLWLLAGNAEAPRNLRREAMARGVAPDRLVFAPRIAPEDHLARHRLADLFLDSLPYNAHTTASDALWAGLPVLTCQGTTFAGRVASSLLHAVGLPELITHSRADYEALGGSLARDRTRLAGIKARLARNRECHPLFDTDRFRRHIEAAYLKMWERSQRGEPPTGFAMAPIR